MISSLFVAASVALFPARPVPAAPAPLAGAMSGIEASSQPVRLQTADKQDLAGRYFAPAGKRKKLAPAALLIHEAGSTGQPMEALAGYLQKKGFGVLVLDLRGHGGSAAEQLDWSKADEQERKAMWAFAGKDVDAGAAYLAKQDGLHSSNLTVVGTGSGAALALRHAIDDDATRAVVLINPSKEAFGFDVAKGVADLGGLPTFILASKSEKKVVKGIQEFAHEDNDGYEFVSLSYVSSKVEAAMEDSKLGSFAYGWLKDQVRD